VTGAAHPVHAGKETQVLVLNRVEGESVTITVPPCLTPQTIKVTAVDTRMGRVRIGFEADPLVKIHRSEVQERIDKEVQ